VKGGKKRKGIIDKRRRGGEERRKGKTIKGREGKEK
jgi:hypothetical protein